MSDDQNGKSYNDYKADQDRWFDQQRDLAEFREAAEREDAVKLAELIDVWVNRLMAGQLFDTEEEARTHLIIKWKRNGCLPLNYNLPRPPVRLTSSKRA